MATNMIKHGTKEQSCPIKIGFARTHFFKRMFLFSIVLVKSLGLFSLDSSEIRKNFLKNFMRCKNIQCKKIKAYFALHHKNCEIFLILLKINF